jgi:hypothetical protein
MSVKTVMSAHGLDVLVHHRVDANEEDLHNVFLVGVCGASKHRKTWTIGAVDGPRPLPTSQEELQKRLDEFRQEVADEAAWKERTKHSVNGLQ